MSPSAIKPTDNVCLPEHAFHAFDTLYCALTPSAKPIPPSFTDDHYPLFVTWNTRSTKPGRAPRLRGCIGNFSALPLREGIAEYALVSAFEDHRFNAIAPEELPSLECGISLLTDYEDAASYTDWTVGVHGIYISFPNPTSSASSAFGSSSSSRFFGGSGRSTLTATYLPDVIPDQGWSKLEAVDSAIAKAGYRGRITEEIRETIRLRRYQSRKCVVGWEDYVRWREENGETVDLDW